ncbi:hypothetical protein NN561_011725 [Cricetulus griseus]
MGSRVARARDLNRTEAWMLPGKSERPRSPGLCSSSLRQDLQGGDPPECQVRGDSACRRCERLAQPAQPCTNTRRPESPMQNLSPIRRRSSRS